MSLHHLNQAPLIDIQNLFLWYGDTILFQNLTWSPAPNQWTCLMGQSGVGKSSLLRLIAGLHTDKVRIQGKVILSTEIAYLGQDDALFPWLSVYENAILSARLGSHPVVKKNKIKQQALEVLHKIGLGEVLHFYPKQLSGGMRQRAALARTWAENKSIILMDEPFSRLDAITQYQLQNLAAELLKDKTVLLVTHDPLEAIRLADRIDLLSSSTGIETLATFSTQGPRDINNPELLVLQKRLYQTLLNHHCLNKQPGRFAQNHKMAS